MPLSFASGRYVYPSDSALVANPAGTWTISLWIAPQVSAGAVRCLFYLNPGNVLQLNGSTAQFIYGGGIKNLGSVAAWTGGQYGPWTHLAVVKNGTTEVRLFVNGAYVANQTTGISADSAQAASIGAYGRKSDFFVGSMAALKVWSRVLTDTEVRREAAALAPVSASSLRAWFPFLRGYTQLKRWAGTGADLSSFGSGGTVNVRSPLPWNGGGARGVITPTPEAPVDQDLTGALVSNPQTVYHSVINVEGAARTLAGALVSNPQTVYSGQIVAGATADGFRVLADWAGDGRYGHELSDLTGRVRDLQAACGWQTLYGMVAEPATMTLTLDNADGAFNADGAYARLLRPGVLLQFGHAYGGVTRTILTLRVRRWQIAPGSYGERTVIVECADWHDDLLDTTYDPPLEVGAQSTGTAVARLFARVAGPGYPRPATFWTLGVSQLSAGSVLAAYDEYVTTDTGETTLPYLGNNLESGAQGLNADAFIREMCAAEMDGRFRYVTVGATGASNYQYWGRTALAAAYAPADVAAVDVSAFERAEYLSYPLVNDLTVRLQPRSVGSAGSVLANVDLAFRLRAGEERVFSLRFRNPDNPAESCGATAFIAPAASTDYTANDQPDGLGTDRTSLLSVTATATISSARVVVYNTGTIDVYVTLLRVRGTPLTAGSPLEIRQSNPPSFAAHGPHKAQFAIAGIDNVEQVTRYAERYVGRFGAAQEHYRQATFYVGDGLGQVDGALDAGLLRYARNDADGGGAAGSMMALLKLTGGWVDGGREGVYLVAGVQHSVSMAGGWRCTLLLEDASSAIGVWRLGSPTMSVLGSTTQLAF